MSLLTKVEANRGNLSKTEEFCFEKILKDTYIQKDLTIQLLSDNLNVSTTTIFRMVKKLGYSSFKEFRYDLIYSKIGIANQDHMQNVDILDVMKNQFNNTINYFRELDIDSIVHSILESENVLVCGSGMNNYIGRVLEVKLNLSKVNTKYSDDQWFLFLEAADLTPKDILIILSQEGETEALINIARKAQLGGARIIFIGEFGDSTLSRLADYRIFVSKVENEGIDIDSKLQIHVAVNYLTKKIIQTIEMNKSLKAKF